MVSLWLRSWLSGSRNIALALLYRLWLVHSFGFTEPALNADFSINSIGFGKTVQHNLLLLRHLESIQAAGRPVALGVSRKSFLGALTGSPALEDRAWPTVALTSFARSRGAVLIRVHEVKANAEALRMTEAILEASE